MYIKPTAAFRMSGTTKRMLSTILDPHLRGVLRRSMVQAELAAQIKPKADKRGRGAPATGADVSE